MKVIVIHDNTKRKIIKIEDENTKMFNYYWMENNKIIEHPAEYQDKRTVLSWGKDELQKLFPNAIIDLSVKRCWDNEKQKIIMKSN